ncbi:MAG: coiled coil domain-containing protein, partial [Desulfobacteraceae bacterium]|nr:coiled coil domain-containing protein [Desulfobacteraceae bacterium]
MSMKEAYQQKLEAQLDEWNVEIDKLKAKADKAEAEAQIQYYKQIEDMRVKQKAAREKLTELKEAGE